MVLRFKVSEDRIAEQCHSRLRILPAIVEQLVGQRKNHIPLHEIPYSRGQRNTFPLHINLQRVGRLLRALFDLSDDRRRRPVLVERFGIAVQAFDEVIRDGIQLGILCSMRPAETNGVRGSVFQFGGVDEQVDGIARGDEEVDEFTVFECGVMKPGDAVGFEPESPVLGQSCAHPAVDDRIAEIPSHHSRSIGCAVDDLSGNDRCGTLCKNRDSRHRSYPGQ